jgi:predicted esterase
MIRGAPSGGLAQVLEAAGAELAYKTFPTGHNLTQDDLTTASHWLAYGLEHS